MSQFEVRIDDLSGDATLALLKLHLKEMHENSPQGQANALDLSGLREPRITFWSVWNSGALMGIGALKVHGGGTGELKSMRTAPSFLRRGVAAALLDHIIDKARASGLHRLSLETGSGPAFVPAVAFYRRHGFVPGEAFADYTHSDFNQFLHLDL